MPKKTRVIFIFHREVVNRKKENVTFCTLQAIIFILVRFPSPENLKGVTSHEGRVEKKSTKCEIRRFPQPVRDGDSTLVERFYVEMVGHISSLVSQNALSEEYDEVECHNGKRLKRIVTEAHIYEHTSL